MAKLHEVMTNAKNGNGLVAQLPIIISTLLVLIAIVGAFWSIANPQRQIDELKQKLEFLQNQTDVKIAINRDLTISHVEQLKRFEQVEARQRDGLANIARLDEVSRRTTLEQDRRTDTYVRTDKYMDAHARLIADISRIQGQLENAFPAAKVFDQINDRLKRHEEWTRTTNASPVSVLPTKP